MFALETLLLFVALAFAVWVYRWLTHSKWFARLVGGVLETPPETDKEVIHHLNDAEDFARRRAEQASEEAIEKKETAAALRRRTGRSK